MNVSLSLSHSIPACFSRQPSPYAPFLSQARLLLVKRRYFPSLLPSFAPRLALHQHLFPRPAAVSVIQSGISRHVPERFQLKSSRDDRLRPAEPSPAPAPCPCASSCNKA